MAAYQLKTFADIVAAVREELQIQSSDTTAINRIKRDINMVYAEVVGENRWWWLQGKASIQLPAYISSGTAEVTTGSSLATLTTALGGDKRGYYFAVDGYNEIYTIESNSGSTVRLNAQFTGVTNGSASYKVWTDKLPLPTDCKETIEITHDNRSVPLDGVGLQEFRRIRGPAPRAEGRPSYYHTGDFVDPIATADVAAMPALSTRASSGVVKTLVFSAGVPSTLVAGTRLRITGSEKASYNGDISVASVSTTAVTNDTLVYVGILDEEESATADTTLTVQLIDTETELQRYRELLVYPAIYSSRVTLHVDYVKEATALEDDADEPAMPLEDRSVILYGVLHRAWSKARNPEESSRNFGLYQSKLTKMQGKLQDSFDKPRLSPSKLYVGAKRSPSRTRSFGSSQVPAGGGQSGAVVTGTPNTVATFNASGEMEGSTSVSTTELGYLDGVTGAVQTQIDALDTRVDTAEADIDTNAADIVAEAASRASADTSLQTNIDAEATTRASADTTLQTNITAEATARAAADTTLQTDINTRALSSTLTTHTSATAAHGATGAVVGTTNTQALTNKTLVVASNTITTAASGNLTATELNAALAELQTDIDTRDTAASVSARFNTTTGHDHDGTDSKKVLGTNIDSAASSSGTVLTADGAGGSSWATPATAPDQSYECSNLSISASVAASALTIALKTKAGTDASGSDVIKIGFRSSTITSGVYTQRSVTGAKSVVVSSGSTLGHASGVDRYIYVYAIDNAGTVEMAVSSAPQDETQLATTTAEGGAGAADSNTTLYSTTARANVPIRLIGRLKVNEATAGTWASAPSEIALSTGETALYIPIVAAYDVSASTGNTTITSGATEVVDFDTKVKDSYGAVTTGASWVFTAPATRTYNVSCNLRLNTAAAGAVNNQASIQVFKNGSLYRYLDTFTYQTTTSVFCHLKGSTDVELAKGDTLDIRCAQGAIAAGATVGTGGGNSHVAIHEVR
jgi:hypothetical protein